MKTKQQEKIAKPSLYNLRLGKESRNQNDRRRFLEQSSSYDSRTKAGRLPKPKRLDTWFINSRFKKIGVPFPKNLF